MFAFLEHHPSIKYTLLCRALSTTSNRIYIKIMILMSSDKNMYIPCVRSYEYTLLGDMHVQYMESPVFYSLSEFANNYV